MNRIARRVLLVCLLLVALPLRGFATTSMLACGPNHQQKLGAVGQDVEYAGSAWHDHANGVSHQHSDKQRLASIAGQSSQTSGHTTSAGRFSSLSSAFECGTCALCCASAVVTSNTSVPITFAANATDFPAFARAYPFPPVHRLDRPPRIIID